MATAQPNSPLSSLHYRLVSTSELLRQIAGETEDTLNRLHPDQIPYPAWTAYRRLSRQITSAAADSRQLAARFQPRRPPPGPEATAKTAATQKKP